MIHAHCHRHCRMIAPGVRVGVRVRVVRIYRSHSLLYISKLGLISSVRVRARVWHRVRVRVVARTAFLSSNPVGGMKAVDGAHRVRR